MTGHMTALYACLFVMGFDDFDDVWKHGMQYILFLADLEKSKMQNNIIFNLYS